MSLETLHHWELMLVTIFGLGITIARLLSVFLDEVQVVFSKLQGFGKNARRRN
jgi:hypothetical protein